MRRARRADGARVEQLLEELVVDFVPKKGTVVVRGRPGDAAKGSVRRKVQGEAAPAAARGRKKGA
mgnify:CR=1 FL=1